MKELNVFTINNKGESELIIIPGATTEVISISHGDDTVWIDGNEIDFTCISKVCLTNNGCDYELDVNKNNASESAVEFMALIRKIYM
jgi:hypothetical protein